MYSCATGFGLRCPPTTDHSRRAGRTHANGACKERRILAPSAPSAAFYSCDLQPIAFESRSSPSARPVSIAAAVGPTFGMQRTYSAILRTTGLAFGQIAQNSFSIPWISIASMGAAAAPAGTNFFKPDSSSSNWVCESALTLLISPLVCQPCGPRAVQVTSQPEPELGCPSPEQVKSSGILAERRARDGCALFSQIL
jgi:hypothetical protein